MQLFWIAAIVCSASILGNVEGQLFGKLTQNLGIQDRGISNFDDGLQKIFNRFGPISSVIPKLSIDPVKRPYESDYCYDDSAECGPSNWKGSCRKGKSQSPIDIQTSSVEQKDLKGLKNPLVFSAKYKQDEPEFFIGNHGHSIVVKVQDRETSDAKLTVEDLDIKYKFAHIHFHWGSTDEKGSEHTVNGKAYPMEIHFVHHDDEYDNLGDALAEGGDNSIAIIVVFVQIGAKNKELATVVEEVSASATNNTHGYVRIRQSISLYDILPPTDDFYRYKGSLSVPKCTENVLYHVLKTPIEISKKQIQNFREVKVSRHKKMSDNYREIQPLNGRKVTFFEYSKHK